jgi:hypothetical protein
MGLQFFIILRNFSRKIDLLYLYPSVFTRFHIAALESELRGRVSEKVTNGSKRVLMEVIRVLCVSRGSSSVQFHESLGRRSACTSSEAGFGSKNGDLDL